MTKTNLMLVRKRKRRKRRRRILTMAPGQSNHRMPPETTMNPRKPRKSRKRRRKKKRQIKAMDLRTRRMQKKAKARKRRRRSPMTKAILMTKKLLKNLRNHQWLKIRLKVSQIMKKKRRCSNNARKSILILLQMNQNYTVLRK